MYQRERNPDDRDDGFEVFYSKSWNGSSTMIENVKCKEVNKAWQRWCRRKDSYPTGFLIRMMYCCYYAMVEQNKPNE